MKVIDIIRQHAGKPGFSIEIVPPAKGLTQEELISSIDPFMKFGPAFLNVTSHRNEYVFRTEPDGTQSRHLMIRNVSQNAVCTAILTRYPDVEVVPHIICGGWTSDEIQRQLYDFKFIGIDNLLALRGDPEPGESHFVATPGGFLHTDGLVRAIRSFGNEDDPKRYFCIGVGAYPEVHYEAADMKSDIEFLKMKVDAGADYIVTQMFFDNSVYYRFVDECCKAGISVPIIPGLKPLSTLRQMTLLPERFHIRMPSELQDQIRRAELSPGPDLKDRIYRIGTEWCIRQSQDLLRQGSPLIHYYTMGRGKNIAEIISECFA